MPNNTGVTPLWVWLTICAILIISALALGYTLFDARVRLSTAQRELAIARENETQTRTLISEFKNAFANLQSDLAEAKAKLEKQQKREETLKIELENAKTTESWKLLTERTVALDKATAYRRELEKDLAKAKSEIEKLKSELNETNPAATD